MRSQIVDSFDVRNRVAIEYGAEGVVVICTHLAGGDMPVLGAPVLIIKTDGWMRTATIGEVKIYAASSGFFIGGMTSKDVPVGTRVVWGEDLESLSVRNLSVA